VTATEATRIARNSEDFQKRILAATGWKVDMLAKEREAKISGLGIAATFYGIEGLVMDMGGGSVELNYAIHRPHEADQKVLMSDNPINLHYGAAALTKLLNENDTPEKQNALFEKIVGEFKDGFEKLNIPDDIKSEDGFTIYMNGGGFRSLGYLSMSERPNYRFPIINGYSISAKQLAETAKRVSPRDNKSTDIDVLFPKGLPFRVGKRRAGLLPASGFLIQAIMNVIKVRYVYFSEGGVRQGYCFDKLPKSKWSIDPLESFIESHPLRPKYPTEVHHQQLLEKVKSSIPSIAYEILDSDIPSGHSSNKPRRLERLLPNLIYLAFWSMHLAKESRPLAAFQLSLGGGALANTLGLTHVDRAVISWCLMYRYNEDGSEEDISTMAPGVYDSVKELVPGGEDGRKICEIVGKLIGFAILCHPADDLNKPEEKLTEFTLSEQLNTMDTTKPKKKHVISLTLTDKLNKSDVYLIKNKLVKKAAKHLEKKYTFGGKNEISTASISDEIEIKVKNNVN
jgi:retrograde regulation protein 2